MKTSFSPRIFPYLIFKKGVKRSTGKMALKGNITVTKAISEMMRTMLGPKGLNKILRTHTGEIVITGDGATVLKKIDIFFLGHPILNILIEAAKTQDRIIGDGTKTVVVLAGELVAKAEKLIEKRIHPNVILKGYKEALKIALQHLQKISYSVKAEDKETIEKVVATSLCGRSVEPFRYQIAPLIVDAVVNIAERRYSQDLGENLIYDIDNIKIIKAIGGSILESELVKGVVIDEEVVHPLMPRKVFNARIALIYEPLEIRRRKDQRTFLTSYLIEIKDPSRLKSFKDEEAEIIREKVEKLIDVGANVVLTPKHIDELSQFYLAKAGILAVKRVRKTDMALLTKVTGGKLVSTINELTEDDLGHAGIVEERKIGEKKFVYVRDCKNFGAVSIVLRANSEGLLDEIERDINNSIMNLITLYKNMKIVPGGGATEMALATAIRRNVFSFSGKEQLAMLTFGDALEMIAYTLAENAGLNAVEILTQLRALHEEDKYQYGIEVISGKIKNMFESGIVEPYDLKEHLLKVAVEAASVILRIDDITMMPQKQI